MDNLSNDTPRSNASKSSSGSLKYNPDTKEFYVDDAAVENDQKTIRLNESDAIFGLI